jgi:hypothetical protein
MVFCSSGGATGEQLTTAEGLQREAGAGVKRGHPHGATDEFGRRRVEKAVTILHLLGLDPERRSCCRNGIERRLRDVQSRGIRGLLS